MSSKTKFHSSICPNYCKNNVSQKICATLCYVYRNALLVFLFTKYSALFGFYSDIKNALNAVLEFYFFSSNTKK